MLRTAALLFCLSAAAQVAPAAHAPLPPQARLDVNHASLEQLLTIPGLTRSWAGRIVRYRPYRSKQDLLEKGVVSSEVYDRIRNYVIAHRDKKQ